MEFRCLVKPKSKTDQITVHADGTLRIKIRVQPVDGKANKYLVKYLAKTFQLPQSSIQIISGFANSHKRINIVADESTIKSTLKKL